MDLDVIATLLGRAIPSLELDAPLHPWWLGEERPRRPARLDCVLASPCPSPTDLEPERLLEAFLPQDRETIERQIDEGYEHLIVSSDDPLEPIDEASVVHVQFGVPLIGQDRVLLRVCTRNLYGDANRVTGDHHAWLDPAGALPPILSHPQRDLASSWDRWVVGRSPGLRVDVNTAPESELVNLPGIDLQTVHRILAGRPFTSLDELDELLGAEWRQGIGRLIDRSALRSAR